MSDWRPIETAPKDGTEIDIAAPFRDTLLVCRAKWWRKGWQICDTDAAKDWFFDSPTKWRNILTNNVDQLRSDIAWLNGIYGDDTDSARRVARIVEAVELHILEIMRPPKA